MVLAGVVGSGNNLSECFGPARDKDLPNWLLRWAWTIHAVVLLVVIAAGTGPRNCRLDGGLWPSGTLHGCLDLGLLPAFFSQLIGRISNFEPAETF